MPHHQDHNRLSYGDALFLYLEREGMPLNVASVNVFEGKISFEACTAFIESKLPLIPRYRQRVMPPPFNIGLPTWEFDAHFDIRNHVRQVTLKQGTDAELKAVAGKILSGMLDRQRPLWDFTLVHGLKDNHTAVITRMHHCLADGLAGVALLNVLMDPSSEVHPLPKTKARFRVRARKVSPASLLDELILSSSSVAEQVLTAQTELLNVLQQVLGAVGHSAGATKAQPQPTDRSEGVPAMNQFARFMPEVSGSTQRLPFNIICRGPQNFRWAEIPLADIKAVKQACGATVNDVVLTVVASAIQRYVELRKVAVRGRLLRIVVPVNVRGNGDANDLGNRITFLPVTIPLDIRSPRKLLTAIRERLAFLKGTHVAELVGLAGTMLGTIPTPAQLVIGSIVNQLPLGLCNTICTNVRGPEAPLYLLGHKMQRCYPYVPIGGDIGINCAVLTYDGTAYFGFTGDAHAAPDLGRLEKFLTTSFAALRKSVGGRTPSPKRGPSKAKQSTAAASPAPTSPAPKQADSPSVVAMPIQVLAARLRREENTNEFQSGVAV
jgi:diacylglycerol O-acyltransferase / wax synthase